MLKKKSLIINICYTARRSSGSSSNNNNKNTRLYGIKHIKTIWHERKGEASLIKFFTQARSGNGRREQQKKTKKFVIDQIPHFILF
jgi:hypothetical protein